MSAARGAPEAEGLIGRERELRQLDQAVAAARDGRRGLVVISGDAGIGKTRLCEELLARSRDSTVTAFGSCWPDGGAPALWPWHSVVADLCGAGAAALLDGDRGVDGVDPDRFSRFAAVTDRLAEACATGATVVVIDDVHAADPGSLLLARFAARRLRAAPFLLVLTRRPDRPGDPAVAELLDTLEAEAVPIRLHGFDAHETRAFLGAHGEDPDDELVLAALRVTGGNPLLLRQLVALGAPGPEGRRLPDGIRDIVDRVMTEVPTDVQAVLRVSAVLGRAPAVADVAAVARRPAHEILAAVEEGRRRGLLVSSTRDAFSFSHELVREAIEASLPPADLLDAHARAAEVVTGGTGIGAGAGPSHRLVRRAHHALWAAARSAEDTRRAVAACRAAADDLILGFAYEHAASLLGEAAAAHERSGLGEPPAALLVEWAHAVLLCGRLGEARTLFDRAAGAAEDERDAVLLARAALGLGGVWVSQERTPDERARVRGLQRRAQAGLPPEEARLRCRLAVRIAAEEAYPGGAVDGVLAALDEARRLGDEAVLAEALSLTHHSLLTPDHLGERLAVADELIRVASAAGDGVLTLMGLCWRAVDLFQLADPLALRALAALRRRADALQCRSILYIAETMEVMLLIRAGALEEAEARATSCYELGIEVGDVDALGYFGGHLVTIRYLQGREAEIVDVVGEMADAPTLVQDDFAIRAAAAALAARAGRHDQAAAALDRLTAGGVAGLPRSSTWLAAMFAVIEAAALLGRADLARECHELVVPFAAQPIMPSLAVTCFGSTERALGMAALAAGDVDAGVAHLERALTANRSLGHRPMATISQADLAGALRRRASPGDRERATELLETALVEARSYGLSGRAVEWERELVALRAPGPEAPSGVVRREGSHWVVALGEHRALVPHLVGMSYLAQLLARPGVPIAALDLVGAPAGLDVTGQTVVDARARRAYEQRARELAEDIAEAEDHYDLARAERLRDELDAVVDELARTTGLGGRQRTFAGPGERARTAVRKALKRSLDEIERADAELGALLQAAIRTGATCSYDSDAAGVTWSVVDPAGGSAP